MTHPIRHFLDLNDIPADDLRAILHKAAELKQQRDVVTDKPLAGKKLAMIFEKTSLRTRVSFEVGMFELGGHALYLNSNDLQLGRGETISDTARVLSRYVDVILLRCHAHDHLAELAESATVPVINALSDLSHPCQLMADVMTYEEHRGPIQGKTVAWIGDGSNVCNSFISAAVKFDFTLRLCCPPRLQPSPAYLQFAQASNARIEIVQSPIKAVENADAVVTDIWVSMGMADTLERRAMLRPYQVTPELMKRAAPDALFLHCLPVHRGEEVTADVVDGPQSVVFDEAENRLHAQKAILMWCLHAL